MTAVTTSVLIRAPRLTDAAVVAALSSELGYPTTAQQMQARLTMVELLPMHIVRVAEMAEQVVGWVHAEHGLSLEYGERVELLGLVVAASVRRVGTGRLLVQSIEEWARARNVERLMVRSNVTRADSHLFYPALGFQVSKTQAVYTKALLP